jgi:perosamine synthetase
VAAALTACGVGTSVHFQPVHRFGYFRRLLGDQSDALPATERLADQLLSLPMHPHLDDEDVTFVCEQIARLATSGRG